MDDCSPPSEQVYNTVLKGRADVSFTEGSFQTPTPNLDKFAWEGIILDRHYVNQICTPTRGAFLTGKYAFQLGNDYILSLSKRRGKGAGVQGRSFETSTSNFQKQKIENLDASSRKLFGRLHHIRG